MLAVDLPTLVILAADSGASLSELFSRRGFVTHVVDACETLAAHLDRRSLAPAAAILDFALPEAPAALRMLHRRPARPALIGIAPPSGPPADEELLDAAFVRPVDPARLFARVVKLVAARRKGRGRSNNRLTGIVAVVHGNELFALVEREIRKAVPPVNAGAILEKALLDLGSDPSALSRVDLAALLASGRLAGALERFGEPTLIRRALESIARFLVAA